MVDYRWKGQWSSMRTQYYVYFSEQIVVGIVNLNGAALWLNLIHRDTGRFSDALYETFVINLHL